VIRLDRLGQRRHAPLYIQKAAVDRALVRSVTDLEIFWPRSSASPITSKWGVVADGAGHRGATGHQAARPARKRTPVLMPVAAAARLPAATLDGRSAALRPAR